MMQRHQTQVVVQKKAMILKPYSDIADNINIDTSDTPNQDKIVEHPDSYKLHQKVKWQETLMRQATWPLDEGVAKFQWPAEMSRESLNRLEAWIELIKLDIKSSVKATSNHSTSDSVD